MSFEGGHYLLSCVVKYNGGLVVATCHDLIGVVWFDI